MPTSYIEKMAKKHKVSVTSLEKKWETAKEKAKEQNHSDDFGYITSIFKKMIGESFMSFKSYLTEYADTKVMLKFRVWCDKNNMYVNDYKAIIKFGKELNVSFRDLKEMAEDLNVEVPELEWRKYVAN